MVGEDDYFENEDINSINDQVKTSLLGDYNKQQSVIQQQQNQPPQYSNNNNINNNNDVTINQFKQFHQQQIQQLQIKEQQQQSPPDYSEYPIYDHLPDSVRVTTNSYKVEDEDHYSTALIFFIIGFGFFFFFLFNIRYLKSRNKKAKKLAKLSLLCALFSMTVIFTVILIYK